MFKCIQYDCIRYDVTGLFIYCNAAIPTKKRQMNYLLPGVDTLETV